MKRCFSSRLAEQLCKQTIARFEARRLSLEPGFVVLSRCMSTNPAKPVFHAPVGDRLLSFERPIGVRSATTLGFPEPVGPPTDIAVSPYDLVQAQIDDIYRTIPKELSIDLPVLTDLAAYYFLGSRGKAFRPMVILLVASLCNKIVFSSPYTASRRNQSLDSLEEKSQSILLKDVSTKQQRLAMICEMIHTASLIHDDVIDASDMRRGQPTLHKSAGEKKAILTGDFILAVCCKILAGLRNPDVIVCVAQVVEDLVKGELVQMSQSFAAPDKRFDQYLRKTYLKTASLIANSCKAVAIFAQEAAATHAPSNDAVHGPATGEQQQLSELCYSFGRNVGMAFQIVDDVLDYAATEERLGKPAAGADLRLGIATAPVLYAADLLPNSSIHERISRRFTGPDDYRLTFAEVMNSNVLDKTRDLAKSYVQQAENDLEAITKLCGDSSIFDTAAERRALQQVCDMTLSRDR